MHARNKRRILVSEFEGRQSAATSEIVAGRITPGNRASRVNGLALLNGCDMLRASVRGGGRARPGAGIGGSMARSIGFGATVGVRRRRLWTEFWAGLRRRIYETFGFGLLLGALLLATALLTFDPHDPSLDTAVDTATHNFLGPQGAVLADLLRQGFGYAAFVLPLVLVGWSLRLLLDRPLAALPRKLALLPPALVLAALALSVLDRGGEIAWGGALGWEFQRLFAAA